METVYKVLFWVGLWLLWILWAMYTDATVVKERRKRKQEKLAVDFYQKLDNTAPRDE
jgi:uncharacterized membrane protein YciS (DUF1049 family)